MDSDIFSLSVVLALVLSITLVVSGSILFYNVKRLEAEKQYVECGYTKTMLPGYGSPVWVKE